MTTIDSINLVADAPTRTDELGGPPRSRIKVARFGRFYDAGRYGRFQITRAMYESWQRNLAGPLGGRVSIDFDHSSDKGQGTRAAGWITGLTADRDFVYGDVEWTDAGAAAIRARDWLYISPTFTGNWTDESGKKHGQALIGAGLTNRPFLRSLPPLAIDVDPGHRLARTQDVLARAQLLEQGIDPDDDAEAYIAARDAALTVALESAPIALADLIDPTEDPMTTPAFDAAWTHALSEGRVTADWEGDFRSLAAADADVAVRTLDGLKRVVSDVASPSAVAAAARELQGGTRRKPAGDVDEAGYVLLDASADPDELLADPVALAKARRVLIEDGIPLPASFDADWRLAVDVRRDLVATLQLRAWDDEQAQLARAAMLAQDKARAAASLQGRVERKRAELNEDLDAYARHLVEAEESRKANPHAFDNPLGFDAFLRARQTQRESKR